MVEILDQDLRGAGAPFYATDDYYHFYADLLVARGRLETERARVFLFRNYARVKEEYLALAGVGEELLARVRAARDALARDTRAMSLSCQDRVQSLRRVSGMMNEGRLARSNLIKAELVLEEVERALAAEDFRAAARALAQADQQIRYAESALDPIVSRYSDPAQIARWRRWVQAAVEKSSRDGGTALVVIKLDRKMILYRGGKAVRTWKVGLGRNGLSDKIQNGDDATPEGHYRIIGKNPRSFYHKALLINYPNDEDLRQFALAKKQGQIHPRSGIGGQVEIHGGGKDGMTYGCVALDDTAMDELYSLVEVGTPVTIVGAVEANGDLAHANGGGG